METDEQIQLITSNDVRQHLAIHLAHLEKVAVKSVDFDNTLASIGAIEALTGLLATLHAAQL